MAAGDRGRLRHVDPSAPRGRVYRTFAAVASSRLATWLSRQWIWGAVVWPIDRVLLRVTRGRLGTGMLLPTALLESRGARSGLRRRTAVIYFHDGERVTIVASKAGHPGNPAWFHNVRANPDVLLARTPVPRAASSSDEAERERLWVLADQRLPGVRRPTASEPRAPGGRSRSCSWSGSGAAGTPSCPTSRPELEPSDRPEAIPWS